jgi:hypothetical protein
MAMDLFISDGGGRIRSDANPDLSGRRVVLGVRT